MSQRQPSQNSRDEITEQTLDSSFVFVSSKNYRKYFKKGKVFRTLWPEPANATEQYRDGIADVGRFGEAILVKIRWFVVVQSYAGHCLVVPVHTYDGRGATKSGINADDHCALVAKGQSAVMLEGERLNRAPLHLILENSDVRLKPSSRINFSKGHTVEYNIKISTVGRIAPEDVPTMSEYWLQSINKIRGEATSAAQVSKSVRLNQPLDDSGATRSHTIHHKSRETTRPRNPEVDIYLYLETQIPKLPRFIQNSSKLQREIVFRVWYAADGVFLLARNFFSYLVDNSAAMSAEAIHDALKSLGTPTSALADAWVGSIDQAIAELVDRHERAKAVFMWIACSQWRLTASVLRHALAVEIGSKSLRLENIPTHDDLLSACAGFVSIEKGDGTILIDDLVKNRLMPNQSQWFPDAHRIIADTCATYLFFDDFSSGWLQSEEDRQRRFETFPFYPYATWNWWYHTEPRPDLSYIDIWNVSPAHVQAWYQSVLYWAPQSPLLGGVYLGPGNVTMLHIAAFLDQDTMINWILDLEFPVDVRDGRGNTPLSYAAGRGSMRALERLLERGANMNAMDTAWQTPLMWAFREGQKDIEDFLLGHGARRSESVFPLASPLWFS